MITVYDDAGIVYEIDWGPFKRLGTFFTKKVPNFFRRWADGWYPGKLVKMIILEGMIKITERVTNFMFDWADKGPERIGRYFEELFYFADDATQATKAATIAHGVGTIFKSVWDSPIALRAIQTAAGAVGVNPQVSKALQGLVTEGWNAVGYALYGDFEANRAWEREEEYEALIEDRIGKFSRYMENEGIPMGALMPVPDPPAGWSVHPLREPDPPAGWSTHPDAPITQSFLYTDPEDEERPIRQTFLYTGDEPLESLAAAQPGRMGALVLGAGALAFLAMKR